MKNIYNFILNIFNYLGLGISYLLICCCIAEKINSVLGITGVLLLLFSGIFFSVKTLISKVKFKNLVLCGEAEVKNNLEVLKIITKNASLGLLIIFIAIISSRSNILIFTLITLCGILEIPLSIFIIYNYLRYKKCTFEKNINFQKKYSIFLLVLIAGSFILSIIQELLIIGISIITMTIPIIFVYCIIKYYKNKKIKTDKKLSFSEFASKIQSLDPDEFEDFTCALYAGLGYKSKRTPKGPDGGKDIILEDKQGIIYVECKRYLSAKIGREILQKLVGATIPFDVKRAIIFTCGELTKYAEDFIKIVNSNKNTNLKIEVVDLTKMYKLYKKTETPNFKLKLV